jgi:hypothetical protein
VRIIDFILEKNKKEESARVVALRNMRFLMNQASAAIELSGRLEVDRLKKELEWSKGILNKRKKYFKNDEIKHLETFYGLMEAKVPELDALILVRQKTYAGTLSGDDLQRERDRLSNSMNCTLD